MGLHEAWVADGVIRCRCSNAAVGFLHYDSEDEARVCVGFEGDDEGCVVDGCDFVVGVGGDVE